MGFNSTHKTKELYKQVLWSNPNPTKETGQSDNIIAGSVPDDVIEVQILVKESPTAERYKIVKLVPEYPKGVYCDFITGTNGETGFTIRQRHFYISTMSGMEGIAWDTGSIFGTAKAKENTYLACIPIEVTLIRQGVK